MSEHRAADLADLKDNAPSEVELDGRKVLLVRRGDEVHALAATCPHRGVPLKNGVIDGDRIVCPAHRASFDLRSGDLLEPPACEALASYAVRIDQGAVHVGLPDDAREHPVPRMARRGGDDRCFVIVGSGAAGWRAAETLRREGFAGRVVVVTDEGAGPLDRVEFSKGYLQPEEQPDIPYVRHPEAVGTLDIELVEGTVSGLDAKARRVSLERGEGIGYDRLLIATGSEAVRLDLPGAGLEGIHTLRTLKDADGLRSAIAARQAEGPCRIAIVGGGFIGLEAAAALGGREGVEVTVIVDQDKPLAKLFGDAFAERILKEHRDAGVTLLTGAEVSGFQGRARIAGVDLASGETVAADLVVMAVGAKPRTGWLPFDTASGGGIDVDDGMAVPGAPDIFLAGDIARVPTQWGRVRIEHWRFAQETGELAARNMLDQKLRYEGTPFFWTKQQAKGSYSYTGHAEAWDRLSGAPEGKSFAVSYVQHDRVSAVLALGFSDEVTLTGRRMAGTGPLPVGEVDL